MEVTHFNSSDSRHVVEAPSVKNYKCLFCGKEEHSFNPGAPFCTVCQKYMVLDSKIEANKVKEIKNRTVGEIGTLDEESKKLKKGRAGRYDDNIIRKSMKAVIKTRNGGLPLLLEINMDKSAFMHGLVHLMWGSYHTTTSINEIGKAFTPFDPTPKIVQKIGNDGIAIPMEIKPERRVDTTKIGEISVIGGRTQYTYDNAFVRFKWKGQQATFSMVDIAMVLHYAI